MTKDAAFYELQFRNRPAVPDHPRILARWASESEKARRELRCFLDVPYGAHPMQKLDIYAARGECRAVLMFIHGGYWRGMDKNEHGFVASALADQGVTVVTPNYALCPEVSIAEIVRQIQGASAWLYRHGDGFGVPPDRLYVAGHSAGGHLAAMMMATSWPQVGPDLPAKLFQGGLAISGLYDLREMINVASINCDLKLDIESATAVSPIFMQAATDAPLYLAVGSDELPPFQRQHADFGRHWENVLAESARCDGENHYSILLQLIDKKSELRGLMQRMMRPWPAPHGLVRK
ncbi:MAG: alpha/beta hydrolase [Pseudomonadota bacterium]